MNILVTGGFGVNGVWVVRELLQQGHTPVIYDSRMDTSLLPDLIQDVEIIIGDILDMEKLLSILKKYKIDIIIHMGALMPSHVQSNPIMGVKVNALGTLNVLEAARIMDIRRVIFTSSKAAYSPFAGDYGYPRYKPVDEY